MLSRKKLKKALKAIENTIIVIVFSLSTWIIASYIDVIAHNLSSYEYAWWNYFEIAIRLKG